MFFFKIYSKVKARLNKISESKIHTELTYKTPGKYFSLT